MNSLLEMLKVNKFDPLGGRGEGSDIKSILGDIYLWDIAFCVHNFSVYTRYRSCLLSSWH